ncbi:MAG: GAF domain-containing protein [Armatimonadetes bacterium]|nr:GAF domain-containing protein [Armatimonadota bacterium]
METQSVSSETLQRLALAPLNGFAFRKAAMEALATIPGYDWCGIYALEDTQPGAPQELVLDAYVGAETDHTRIPVGRGVCGTAVATGENQIVDDVRALDNYLSCSLATKSEIVVLIRRPHDPLCPVRTHGTEILGQIDIDSHQQARFDERDEHFLTALAALIAERW